MFFKKFFGKKYEVTELEDTLYENGVEPKFVDIIVESLSKQTKENDVRNALKQSIKENINIKNYDKWKFEDQTLYLIIGNNGSGKTTFIGKFLNFLNKQNLNPSVIAADTYRAAAMEQLEYFAKKLAAPFYKGLDKEDPAAVVFKGIQSFKDQSSNIVVDTSGRQHNNKNLMGELKKISNTILKGDHKFKNIKTLLTLDANIGLASKQIIQGFIDCIPVDGLIINKVDSNSKYGSLLTIINDFNIPIIFEGYGEDIEDLRMFEFDKYLDRLI